ncbi:MAG: UbiX family flavin prenyltransferase [Sphingobacteriales bacterium]|nr:MAG: UbiX family flavin prenyltransferase [Sphingobacteriales bacterium]
MIKMKIAVAVTGASGSIYAKLFLQKIKALTDAGEPIQTDLVWSKNALTVWKEELDDESYTELPFKSWDTQDYYAPFASGSAGYDALVIIPCSMGTLGRIATGISDSLITRAADVMLKERKKLICVIRETPYNLVHLNNMKTVTEAGGIICPASPSFYSKPKDLEAAAMTVVDRVLGLAGLDSKGYKWGQ